MRRGILLIGAIIVLAMLAQGCNLLGITATTESPPAPPSRNVEGLDFKAPAVYENAMAKGKITLIYFTTSIAPTDEDVAPSVNTLETRYIDDIIVVRAFGDEDDWVDVVFRHDVKYFPTLILLDESGEDVQRWEGFVDLETVEQATRELIDF